MECLMHIWCTKYINIKIPVHPIHGKPLKKHLMAINISQPQLRTLPKPRHWHVAIPTLYLHPPTHKGLCMYWHNKAIHQTTHTQQLHKHTRCYTLANVDNRHNRPQDITILRWLIQCMPPKTCTCTARLRTKILCILGPLIDGHTPFPPNPPNTIQFIYFTYCHDRFLNTTTIDKTNKCDPLIQTLKNHWMEC